MARKLNPFNDTVIHKSYGFVKTYSGKEATSISIFCADSNIDLFRDISSLFSEEGEFTGTISDLKSGYEFSTEEYDSVWCYICEDAQDMVKQLVKCGLPKEAILGALSKCSSGEDALIELIDSLNENFMEMFEERSNSRDEEEDTSWDEDDDKEDTSWDEDEEDDSSWDEDDDKEDSSWDEDEEDDNSDNSGPATMEEIKKRFDALYKEVKKSRPKSAKAETIRAEAFRLLKEEFPTELEDVEIES